MRNKVLHTLASILCAVMILCTPMHCLATEVSETGTKDVPVTASIQPTFTVSLPPNLELVKSGSTATCRSQVGVKGDIEVSGAVKVKPDKNFAMYDVTLRPSDDTVTPDNESAQTYPHKTPIAANTNQTVSVWPYAELVATSAGNGYSYNADTGYHNTDLEITVNGFTAGTWEGVLNFNIKYESVLTVDPGLYNESGVMTVSWNDLVSDGTIHVTDGVVTTNYASNSNSSSEALVGKLVIPNSVTSIGSSAFSRCSRLTSVTIPDSVTSIDQSAFGGCIGLTSVTIPNSVTSMGRSVFFDCTGLTSVTIPNSVTSIDGTFQGCSSLTSVTIPNSVTSIGMGTFNGCEGLTSVTIPNSVTSIGTMAFGSCTGLTSVTIPDSVTSIGTMAFQGCSGLTSVTFNNPQRWWLGEYEDVKTTLLDSNDLSNTATAATYLTSTYSDSYWTRE